ncbi:MAG TPA: NADPH:quinone oxidoreductase family protein [Quisquiliibacterium sp.]|nr:NADPH:quinone oxidoreductase family protein [Quisquiliibacterium sp.]
MKAVLCEKFGPPETLAVREVPDPVAGKGQVVIRIHAAGVNFPDTLIIEDKYQLKPPLPFSPGGEVAGVVESVGEGVTRAKVGDRVMAFPGFGGYAEKVCVDQTRITRLPEGVSLVHAAALTTTYGTTHHALKDRAQIKPGETLLVLGAAGGTGISAVEMGKLMGARVIAAASSQEKLDFCRAHGADETIDYSREDLRERIKALTGGKGVDVVYDPVGGKYSELAIRSMAWNGRFLVIGFTAGEIPRIPLNLALLKGCSIVGVYYGGSLQAEPERAEANMAELLEWFRSGRITPYVSQRYPLEQAAHALDDIANRRAKGKIVLVTAAGAAEAGA